MGFLEALGDPSLPFVRNAVIGSLLASLLFGMLGSLVTVRRIAGLAGAMSHTVLGGIGIALFLSARGAPSWVNPLSGALVFALLAAFTIGFVSIKARQREDTVINALWAIGMSLGVVFIARTPGYADPMSYLFGNILLVTTRDLYLLGGLDLIVLILILRFYPQIEAASFDEEFAATRGVPTRAIAMVLLAVIAVAIVLLQTFVGIVMVIAMLTLPAGTASHVARNLKSMMIIATLSSVVFSGAGLVVSWHYDLPAGAVIVLIAGAAFFLSSLAAIVVARARAAARVRGGEPESTAEPVHSEEAGEERQA
ncbi:MAG: metal ABC transporter permease [Rectinemataceae bacterium]|nr:metal ABC transporter permease [Spirochaetaceae bacterium]